MGEMVEINPTGRDSRRINPGSNLEGGPMCRFITIASAGAQGIGVFALAASLAYGQTYPNKPIKLVVPNAPGGGSDLVGRVLAEKISRVLGQQVVVENRAGAGGQLAAEFVARSAADGYTLLLGTSSTLITAPALYPKISYNPTTDYAPISLVASTTYLLVIHPSVPARSVKDLINLAKSRPGSLNYASTGPGSPAHLAGELFNSMAGVKTVHIPYKGSSPGTLSVVQGETDLMFGNILPSIPLINLNRLRPLGITSLKRSSLLPDLPTLDESGLRDFEVQQFYSVLAPAGTSSDVIKRLNQEVNREMQSAETKKRLTADGSEVIVSTPEVLGKLIAFQIAKWTKVIKNAGIKPE
jgi:tripartite-type tricarboxylate transporter receptor subunit TctC